MPKSIRTPDGRFNGSIGDGKTNTPQTVSIPQKINKPVNESPNIEELYRKMRAWKPSPAEISQYTEADCWILAQELHRLTGWPYAAITDSSEDINGNPTFTENDIVRYGWVHLGVLTSDGNFLDIRGTQSIGEALDHWDMLQADIYECELDVTTISCHEAENKLSLTTLAKTSLQKKDAEAIAKNMLQKEDPETKCLRCKN